MHTCGTQADMGIVRVMYVQVHTSRQTDKSLGYLQKWSKGQALHLQVRALFSMAIGAKREPTARISPSTVLGCFLRSMRSGGVRESQGSCAKMPVKSKLLLALR